MRRLIAAAIAGCIVLTVVTSVRAVDQRGRPSRPVPPAAGQFEAKAEQPPAPPPTAPQTTRQRTQRPDWWQRTATLAQAAAAVLMLVAVVCYWQPAKHARDAVRAGVTQALTDRMIAQVRYLSENPSIAKGVFPMFVDIPNDRLSVYMAVHPFLLHFENVIALKKHLPKGHSGYHHHSMVYILSLSPAMYEWMRLSGDVWSDDLRRAAEEGKELADRRAQEPVAAGQSIAPGPDAANRA